MSQWLLIEDTLLPAPKDGTFIDLWGYDRDPTPRADGIVLPIELSIGRYTNCFWGPCQIEFDEPLPEAWFQLNRLPNGNQLYKRIWATHYMLIPKGPEK